MDPVERRIVVDVSTYDEKLVNFRHIALAAARKVTSGEVARGIMVYGALMATNKMKGIREVALDGRGRLIGRA